MAQFFKNCSEIGFVHEIMDKQFYPETQEGFDRLAEEINDRCNLLVKLRFYPEDNMLKVFIKSGGTRNYRTFIKNENVTASFFRILDILTAFACGLGYDC